METYQNVLYGREVREETNILIGSSNPQTDNLIGKQANERVVVQEYLSDFRPVEAGHAVKESRLASTVWPDDAVNAVFLDLQVQFIYSNESTKTFCCFFCLENRHQILLRTGSRRRFL